MKETVPQAEDLKPGMEVLFVGDMKSYPFPVKLPYPRRGRIMNTQRDDEGVWVVQVDFGEGCQPYLLMEDLFLITV